MVKKMSDIAWVLMITLLIGCAPHTLYRAQTEPCTSSQPDQACSDHAIQRYLDPAQPNRSYTLGFIEFDDQGQLHSRAQMKAVLKHIHQDASNKDVILVVFVHGWKHSASIGDGNIQTFRDALEDLSALESRVYGEHSREVVGVYLGWRGGSITLPLIEELTFWDRKNTAHKVGHGGVTEILSRLEQIRNIRSQLSEVKPDAIQTRLVVIGHSFGGAIVYSAVSQLLMDRFVETSGSIGEVRDAKGFGDLLVLINPAFEALLLAPLSDMANERKTYFDSQLPVIAILTSEADDATGMAFPIGRWFSTFFEKHRTVPRDNPVTGGEEIIDQHEANITAVGHFDPYQTHELYATERAGRSDAQVFARASLDWEHDEPGSEIVFEGSTLKRTLNSVGRNPYLVIQVDGELIPDHNTINDDRVIGFITQLVQLSTQSEEPGKRGLRRRQIMDVEVE